ncbi:uncharacterized protein LOC131631520 [Vicia villosa]|uniref:uncharacterized protein LOC131631520 n=1 Tax=Vicia villosa TaxID=3911 RepID=UPI00273C8C44|nr:uncharacterized protein LOC131631520 [Vicia villosa]
MDVYGDYALVVNQIKGEWETRHPSLIPYRDYTRRLLTFFNKVEFHHIPREENQMADALATLASMYQVKFLNEAPQITIVRLDIPPHIFVVEGVTDEKEYPPRASSKDRRTMRRLSVCTSIGATPFSLVYGMEVVLQIEIEIPSMRILMEAKLSEAAWCQVRHDQLKLIEEKRMTALCHSQIYQERMKRAFDKKVRPRRFGEGDLMLKKILPLQPDPKGKWTPNYEGPYVVNRAFSGGALTLTTMDGKEFSRPVNADMVKKYFA